MSKEQGSETAVSGSQFIKEEEMAEEKQALKKVSRREFVKGAAAVAGAGALASCAPPATPAPGETAAPAPTCAPAGECPAAATPLWIPETWDYEADVVVVGYGAAGVCAGLAATEAGATVLILEKDSQPRGGNVGCCGGGAAYPWQGPGGVEEYIDYMTAEHWGTVDREQVVALVQAITEMPTWIEEYVGIKLFWNMEKSCSYPALPGGHNPEHYGLVTEYLADVDGRAGAGWEFWQRWHAAATEKGIPLMLATPATQLIQNGATGEILGVKASTEVTTFEDGHYEGGREINVKAKKGVVLACGGYENDKEMRANFSTHPHSAFVAWYGTPFNTGDGVRMAQKVGAKLWHMNFRMCHSFACVPASKELGTGLCVNAYGDKMGANASLIVNREGKRFMNEYFWSGHSDRHPQPWDELRHLRTATDGVDYIDYPQVPMYWVFDDTTMKAGSLRGSYEQWVGVHKLIHPDKAIREQWSQDNEEELAKGWFIKADTLEALGKKIEIKNFFGEVVGMDAAGLVETVSKYNEYCAAGKDLDFGRASETLVPLSKPPFYAMEVCDCQTQTGGGPQHNGYAQTLDAFGTPIPRLYSAGELGFIYGVIYNGGASAAAYAEGRVAGKHAAALEPWD